MFVMWFLSGFVMIFAGFPHVSKEKEFSHLEAIMVKELKDIEKLPSDLSGQLVLEKRQATAIYELKQSRGKEKIYDAKSLKQIDSYSEEDVLKLARSFSGANILSCEKRLELDQWMPRSYCQPWIPIYKCYINDEEHTQLYISAVNGRVVQETTRKSRWAARLGAIPHWIYFKSIRLQTGFWLRLVYWISLLGVFASVSGIILGFLRLKHRRKRQSWSELSIYKKFWHKWHHITGFVFGLFVFTFILSGLISVSDIPQFIAPVHNKQSARQLWNQESECADSLAITPRQIGEQLKEDFEIKRIIWKKVMGKVCVHVFSNQDRSPEVYILKGNELERKLTYTKTELENWAKHLFHNTLFSLKQLNSYNAYYQYSESDDHPLPVWQLQVDDADRSCLYVDPQTGEVIRFYNINRRWSRWLYKGLHSFDFPFLIEHEWLRKLLLLLVSVGGTFVSLSALVLGWCTLTRIIK